MIGRTMTERICNRTGRLAFRPVVGIASFSLRRWSKACWSEWLRLIVLCYIVVVVFASGHAYAVDVPESVFLKCFPPLDQTDSDPVTETWIYAKFDPNNNFAPLIITVVHRSRKGNTYDRTYQYDTNLESDDRTYTWSWRGHLKTNRRYSMTGTLTNNGTWAYYEAQMLDGSPSSSTEFTCNAP